MSLFNIKIYIAGFLFLAHLGYGQEVQWATRILGYSSEYRPGQFGHAFRAKQILGEPSKLPDFGNSPCAWSPAESDGSGEEWIKVGFEKPVVLKQIAVAENFNPGSVARIYAYNDAGKEFLIFDGKAGPITERGRMLRVFPEKKDILANAVKIVLQPSKVSGFNQIDAIGISDATSPIEAKINLAETLPKDVKKENLGKNVNSPGQELVPIITPDGKTLYFTRSNSPGNIGSPDKQDVWYSTLDKNNNWTEAKNIGPPINNAGDNAITSISADGKTIYLINVYRPDGTLVSGFSRSFYTRNGWSFPKEYKIANFYNIHVRNQTEMAVSPQGNVLVLSVQRNDSEGSKDLYVSFHKEDDTWSEPLRMGDVINTADYEGSPFLALDNKTLYFTSSGLSGFGEGDLFVTKRLDDTWINWSKPQNLGSSVNTPQWDGYFNIPASGDYAYFSSSENSIGKEDIFRIRLTPEMKPEPVAVVTGTIFESVTNKPIQSEIVADFKKNNEVFTKATFDPESGEFRLILPLKEIYRLSASQEGYFPVTEEIDLSAETSFKNIRKNLYLQPIKTGQQIRLNNTMFAQSSSDVVSTSYPELDRIATTMTAYPAMEILLEGHTDNQGDTQKNVKLSEDRVLEVKKYLTSKGISAQRIQTKAWGPAKPIASNQTEQSRQKNRRVEFTILKI
jgi:outer membrane protein OmpA-like peptidoglycan-associated protein